jgi:tryptophan halogenase
MDLFRSSGRVAFHDRELFVESNWLSVFIGQHVTPRRHDPLADLMPIEEVAAQLGRMRKLIRDTAHAMPKHTDFLAQECARAGGLPSG